MSAPIWPSCSGVTFCACAVTAGCDDGDDSAVVDDFCLQPSAATSTRDAMISVFFISVTLSMSFAVAFAAAAVSFARIAGLHDYRLRRGHGRRRCGRDELHVLLVTLAVAVAFAVSALDRGVARALDHDGARRGPRRG